MAENGEEQIKNILEDLGLNHLIPQFQKEGIDLQCFLSLNESQINKLGVHKLGDIARITEKVRLELKKSEDESQLSTTKQSSIARNILQHRNTLFGTGKRASHKRSPHVLPELDIDGKNMHSRKKKSKASGTNSRSWTVTVVCLADKEAKTVPSPTEREILFKAGLGFPQLKQCGGFELLICRQNSRELNLVECEWNVRNLRCYLGPQAKLYIRPIQKNISVTAIKKCSDAEAKVKCHNCLSEYSVRELREHLTKCKSFLSIDCIDDSTHSSDSEDLKDPHLTPSYNTVDNKLDHKEAEHMQVACSSTCTQDLENISTPVCSKASASEDIVTCIYIQNPPVDKSFSSSTTTSSSLYVHLPASTQSHAEYVDISNAEDTAQYIIEPPNTVTCTGPADISNTDFAEDKSGIDYIVTNAIEVVFNENITDPVEILRFIQGKIVTGRKLDIDVSCHSGETCEGETNFIMVNREKLLETALDEIAQTKDKDLRKTLEVQFYHETAEDFGGPRREFFRIVLAEIQRKYFQNGLRDYMATDYRTIGKIMALSILQNGSIPTFLGEEILNDIFGKDDPESICTKNLRIGLDCLGLVRIGTVLPAFLHLLRPSSVPLTLKSVLLILKPSFSEKGSNTRIQEDRAYSAFVRYVRSVGSGRRPGLTLSNLMEFVTGASEEPVLGFTLQPSIEFVEVGISFLPTANTCSNSMMLPRPSSELEIPADDKLFDLYDYAFLNTYYGLV
ncbi:unnamed protein product [Mytilus edulis]|uniref:HECT-type E3 ubiquitin transferase n=1 Tax=Mytilus edulis TaxID=6550 RepID=A0A8S3S9R7_MYTED|nr:unnamed protein product [Mytilus edulis]